MVVRSVNKVINCAARSTAWTTGATLKLQELNDVVLKQTKIWFSAGCQGHVFVRIMHNGAQLLPDPLNNYSDSYVGSDVLYPIYLGKVMHQSDLIAVEYRNDDFSDHTITVQYELQPIPTDVVQSIVPAAAAAQAPKQPAPPPKQVQINIIPDEPQRDFVMREPKFGRVGDESERAYVGDHEEDLPEWLRTDGPPETPVHDPRKRRARS